MVDEKFLSTLTLLYVENDENLRNKYKIVFEKLFKKVLIAFDGLEALEKFNDANKKNETIDVIISEISLPLFDGVKLLTHVKKINKNIPFIFTSTDTKTEHLITSIKKGVSDYFTKPIDTFLMLKKVQKSCLKIQNDDKDFDYINELEEYLNTINKVAIVIIFDINGKILYVNDFMIEVSKYLEEELLEQNYNFTCHPDVSKTIFSKQWNQIQDSKKWKGKLKHLAKNDSIFYTNTTIIPVINKEDKKKKKFISINFLTTKEENKKRDYKKKVLYNLQETKRVYQVAQDKIDELRIEISKYGNISKYDDELEKEKKVSAKYYEEIKDFESKIARLDEKHRILTYGVNDKIYQISNMTTDMIDVEFKARNKIKKVEEEIKVREAFIQKISKEIAEQSIRIVDLEDVLEHRDNQLEEKK